MKNIKINKKFFLLIPLIVIVLIGGYILTHSGIGIDANNPPKFIQASFIDLSKIYSISKFRSGSGHDFSGNGEACRSMKHYFAPQPDASRMSQQSNGGEKQLPPAPTGDVKDIAIYAPVDGTITQLAEEHTPIGKQVYITPDKENQFTIRLFHVYPLPEITVNSHIKAGEQIGWISYLSETDISVQIGGMPWNEHFISYFSILPDNLFAEYQKRGIASRDDFIISKEYRDAHPFQCATDKSEAFIHTADYSEEDNTVHLSGYIKPIFDTSKNNQSQPQQNYGNNTPTTKK